MEIKQLLFATDFSEVAELAGHVARDMALRFGAVLHVAHVVPPVTDPVFAKDRLDAVVREFGGGLTARAALLSGRAAPQLVQYARDKRVDLIVMGAHGRTGVTHAILGSVAEQVMRLAPCLVLTVPAGDRRARPPLAAAPGEAPAHHCIVCAGQTDDLVCETCRTRIRAAALERKIEAERPGRRGSSM
jgi:nucleotide-binding universal stress UspA family protein